MNILPTNSFIILITSPSLFLLIILQFGLVEKPEAPLKPHVMLALAPLHTVTFIGPSVMVNAMQVHNKSYNLLHNKVVSQPKTPSVKKVAVKN